MGTTPNRSLPYPELSDTPDVPRDLKALAEKSDTEMGVLAQADSTLRTDLNTVSGRVTTAQNAANAAQSTANNAVTAAGQKAVLPQIAINAAHQYATNTAVVMADAGSIGLTRLDAGTAWWVGFRIDGTTQGFVLAGQKGGFVTRSGAVPVPRQLAESLIDAVEPDLDGVPPQPLKDAGAPPLLVQDNPDPSNGMPAMMVNSDALIALLWSEVRDLRSRVAALESGQP